MNTEKQKTPNYKFNNWFSLVCGWFQSLARIHNVLKYSGKPTSCVRSEPVGGNTHPHLWDIHIHTFEPYRKPGKNPEKPPAGGKPRWLTPRVFGSLLSSPFACTATTTHRTRHAHDRLKSHSQRFQLYCYS